MTARFSTQRPPRYERTRTPFWNDPHIATGMLAAHLDPTTDAASRRPTFLDSSAAWIAALARGGDLLDLGCGPGLYGRRFSDLGLKVTGLDISPGSIEYARAHDPAGDYRVQDYLTMEFHARFDLVTLIWCDYGALTEAERHVLLRRIAAALRPGGQVVLDVFMPAWLASHPEATGQDTHPDGGFFSPLPHDAETTTYHYDDRVSLDRHVITDARGTRVHHIWNTCFTPAELADETATGGLVLVDCFDDVAGTPFTGQTDTLAALLRKA